MGPSSANCPPVAYVSSSSNAEFALVEAETQQIKALSGKGLHSLSTVRLDDELPPGCAVYPVSAIVTVYLEVGKQVDVSALMEKTEARLTKLKEMVERQLKVHAVDGWAEKVSTAVRTAEQERLSEAGAQIRSLTSSMEQFRRLELSGSNSASQE